MKLTAIQRRQKIQDLAMTDEQFRRMYAEFEQAQCRFRRFADKMPRKLRNMLYAYPGMGFFLYHQMLNLVSEHMIFPEEK